MKNNLTITSLVVALSALIAGAPVLAAEPGAKDKQRIKKCKDSAGKWHYGDKADEMCGKSKIIELDQRGVKRKEVAPPLTKAQLAEREANKAALEEEKRQAEAKKKRDEQLLAGYTHEDDIITISKRKSAEIEAQISSAQETLKSLGKSAERLKSQEADEMRTTKKVSPHLKKSLESNRSQTARQEEKIKSLRAEQAALIKKYNDDLERFRELKRRAPGKAPSAQK